MSTIAGERILRYINYFRTEHKKVLLVDDSLHRKLLAVTLLSALAEGRYPTMQGDRSKFQSLVKNHSEWSECHRISISQLHMHVKSNASNRRGLRPNFIAKVEEKYRTWCQGKNPSLLRDPDSDPEPNEFLASSLLPKEIELVDNFSHLSLLYTYRCKLVHEFRSPGHGMEFDERDVAPFYHSSTALETRITQTELVYPTKWFVNLPGSVLDSLEKYYLQENIDPYESYQFGSPWR